METVTVSNDLRVFDELESEVRSYCRSFPALFTRARGHKLWDADGKEYVDFFAGAGSLNYGHNNPAMKKKMMSYIESDGITHGLDMATTAKEHFLKRFNEVILKPRSMEYKVMFPGPTGTNAVESALKLARKVTGRELVMSFTNAFHGMTLGALSLSGNAFKREGAGTSLYSAVSMPYDGYMGDEVDTIEYIQRYIEDDGSGMALPAAVILETIQGEGGLKSASREWLQKLEELCRCKGILLIVDDIQAACGRTGPFFSFEPAGIKPDIICLSKSLSGYGLPMSLTLIKPELDEWSPGEHNGTFRGNNLAFVTSAEALSYWENDDFQQEILRKGNVMRSGLEIIVEKYPALAGEVRGEGMMQGIACEDEELAGKICGRLFRNGVIMETSGANSEVIKLMPPLTIDYDGLSYGMNILEMSIDEEIG